MGFLSGWVFGLCAHPLVCADAPDLFAYSDRGPFSDNFPQRIWLPHHPPVLSFEFFILSTTLRTSSSPDGNSLLDFFHHSPFPTSPFYTGSTFFLAVLLTHAALLRNLAAFFSNCFAHFLVALFGFFFFLTQVSLI